MIRVKRTPANSSREVMGMLYQYRLHVRSVVWWFVALCIISDPAVINEQGDVPARDTKECCACGEARYKMVFQGLWSKQTHPKGFPTKKGNYLFYNYIRQLSA